MNPDTQSGFTPHTAAAEQNWDDPVSLGFKHLVGGGNAYFEWVPVSWTFIAAKAKKKKQITVQGIIQYPSVPKASGNELSLHINYGESKCLIKCSPQSVGNKPISLRTKVTIVNSISEYAKDKMSWHYGTKKKSSWAYLAKNVSITSSTSGRKHHLPASDPSLRFTTKQNLVLFYAVRHLICCNFNAFIIDDPTKLPLNQ